VDTGFWWKNLKQRDHLEDPGLHWGIILRWIFGKWDEVEGTCKIGNEPSGFIKCGEILDQLITG
jgi:hypothetical protein